MDKLKMRTPNLADENFKKLSTLFPNAVTETIDENGEVVRAIDKDVLMQEISCKVVDGKEERYQFTWPDKKKAVLLANSPINMTLRPCREESVDFDNTENLYIEGDNLDVLKLLRETYLGKVKMIYIDPPYNTGNDFVYNDDFAESADEYLDRSGQFDEDGNRLVQNTESNGRFHTDWLNMIYPRLKLAKDLLTDDGVIYISIDDYEVENLQKTCDELFGENNFFALLTRRCMHTVRNSSKDFNKNTDYVLVYAKNKLAFSSEKGNLIREKVEKMDNYPFNDNDGKGPYKLDPIYARNYARPYTHTFENGIVWEAPEGSFPRYSQEHLLEMELNNELDFNGKQPRAKRYLEKVQVGQPPDTLIRETNAGFNLDGTRMLSDVLEHEKIFSQPKPVKLISYLCSLQKYSDNDIILDFFSGSATTAHAVMQLNAGDGGHRKFIMVQLPEETDEKSEAYKAGYKNICEIGKERIRRASAKIKEEITIAAPLEKVQNETGVVATFIGEKEKQYGEETAAKFDGGFRVLKLDSSNMKDVYYNPDEFQPNLLDSLADNIKEDRTAEDLLFQVMLDLGILLSSKIEESTIGGKKVFDVENNHLIACFDENVAEETITAIAKQKPRYFVMRDSSMANDSVATNFEQIFATYSADTIRKVL